jgi:hypothetical protein
MGLELCKSCGRMHYGTDPCKESTGNVDGSAGRLHSDSRLSAESPASVPVVATKESTVNTVNDAHVPQSGRVGNPSPPLVHKQPDEPHGETARSLRPFQGGSVEGAGQTSNPTPAAKPNRNAYMRQYMANWRAKRKQVNTEAVNNGS